MTSSRLDFGKAFGIRAGRGLRGFTEGKVKRVVMKDMVMCMAFTTSKRYMFIIIGLHPFKIIVKKTYRVWKGLRKMHEDTDSGI